MTLDLRTQLMGSVASYGAHLDAIAPCEHVQINMEYTLNRSRFTHALLERGRDMELRRSEIYQDAGLHTDMADRITGLDRSRDWSEVDAVLRRIISEHASFVDETPGRGVMNLVFPHTRESLEQFDLVNAAVGAQLPGVVYGRYLGNVARYTDDQKIAGTHGKLWTPFGTTTVQPKQADFEKMGLSEDVTGEEIIAAYEANGIQRGTLDVAWIQTFENPELMVGKLINWFDAIHLSLNRSDAAKVLGELFVARSVKAKELFVQGDSRAKQTREWQLAQMVVKDWKRRGYRGRIFYEEKTNPATTNRRVRKDQKAIMETTAQLYESTKAA
jgi:hypothetical protein